MNRYFLSLTGGIALIAIGASPAPILANYQNAQFDSTNIQAQDAAKKLAMEITHYVCEEREVQATNHPLVRQVGREVSEYVDTKTGENVGKKLPWKLNELFEYLPLYPNDIPPNAAENYLTRNTVDIVLDNLILYVEAKVYYDKENRNRNYGDPRNYLEISFFESGRTLEEMRQLDLDVITSLRKTFGVTFTDKSIDGLADVIKGTGNQQMYLKGLQYLANAYAIR